MEFTVKGIELYSAKEGRITLADVEGRSSSITLYVPRDEVSSYSLGEQFMLMRKDSIIGDSWETYQRVKEAHNVQRER